MARVTLREVTSAKRVASMIPITTVASIGEQHVLILIVADPLAAALGLHEILGRAAKAALWNAPRERLIATS
jgi:hypothetical protein